MFLFLWCKDHHKHLYYFFIILQDPSRDFGESFATEKIQDDILKNQRDEWVEKEMKKKKILGRVLPKNDKNDNKNKSNNIHTSDTTTFKEELYALPKSLSMSMSNNNETEAGERWLAGMANVCWLLNCKYELIDCNRIEL